MKKIFEILAAVLIAVTGSGCMVAPLSHGQGGYPGGYPVRPGYPMQMPTAQVVPCQPYNADALMAWAKSAPNGGSNHSRQANVSTDHWGQVRCSSYESAGSSAYTPAAPVKP